MKNWTSRNLLEKVLVIMCMLKLTACTGILDNIYDPPKEIVPARGQIVVDATSWSDWYYVDLHRLHQLTVDGDEEALLKAQTEFAAYPIPMEPTGDKVATPPDDRKPGQYMYWFDVLGVGITNSRFAYYQPTAMQTAPDDWAFAVHRNNVRTNGGAVLETAYTSMDELPESSEAFRNMKFTEDEWTENEVWDSQEQMLLGNVPSQGIEINKVLSSWLCMDIPPMPPAFSMNNHVFILRLNDGSYAALQLENYLSPNGTKCHLTINYRYPY